MRRRRRRNTLVLQITHFSLSYANIYFFFFLVKRLNSFSFSVIALAATIDRIIIIGYGDGGSKLIICSGFALATPSNSNFFFLFFQKYRRLPLVPCLKIGLTERTGVHIPCSQER